jgi:menaquinone-specific isochorismate synthase
MLPARAETVTDGRRDNLVSGLARLRELLAECALDEPRRIHCTIEADLDPLDLIDGFEPGALDPMLLYGRGLAMVGTAIEHEIGSLDQLDAAVPWSPQDAVPRRQELRYALSARFDPDRRDTPEWRPFGRCRIWLPAIELDATRRRLTLHWIPRDDGRAYRARIIEALEGWRTPPVLTRDRERAVQWRLDADAHRRWYDQVDDAMSRITRPEAEPKLIKIVAARRLDGEFVHDVRPAELLAAQPLASAGQPWLLQRGEAAWLGETPEILGKRRPGELVTMSLAGTRARGGNARRDRELGEELLSSAKDRHEQDAVTRWLATRLHALTGRRPVLGDLEVHELPQLLHLHRQLRVAVEPALGNGVWPAALHPSPALCGAPRDVVRRWLREHEPFDRGLYGGTIGVLSSSSAHLSVMIRGALLRGREVSLYAGAGLVRGSHPETEWQETQAKLAAVCRRLGLQAPATDESGEAGAAGS